MELVYHEKQDGLLCGQHCLNNLLQGQYFSAVDLADIAQQMDQAEQRHMAEQGVHTEEFRRFMEQPSVNMDDSGMFSVQVLTSALRVWDLTLVPYASTCPLAQEARHNPTSQRAYICNFKDHWLTVRKLGNQWFNLNSLLSCPELISNTYLSLFLTQLQHEGYSIFVVDGNLPPSEADDTLRTRPITQATKPRLLSEMAEENREDQELKAALSASLARAGASGGARGAEGGDFGDLQTAIRKSLQASVNAEGEDYDDLQTAIQMSLQNKSPSPATEDSDLERALRLSLLAGQSGAEQRGAEQRGAWVGSGCNQPPTSPTEEENLEAAIKLSLAQEAQAGPSQPSQQQGQQPSLEELREKRLAFLNKNTP